MDNFVVGDIVWHHKKGYVGKIKSMGYGKDKIDCRLYVLSDYYENGHKCSETYTNVLRLRKDKLGHLLYG